MREYGEKSLEEIEGDELIDGVPAIILPGFESKFADGKAGEIEKRVLEKEGVTFNDFKTDKMGELSSKGDRKAIKLIPQDFKIQKIEKDEFNEGKLAVTLSFFLTKGNYATTILKELIKEEIF